jgi:hypothetical protein
MTLGRSILEPETLSSLPCVVQDHIESRFSSGDNRSDWSKLLSKQAFCMIFGRTVAWELREWTRGDRSGKLPDSRYYVYTVMLTFALAA